MTWLIGAADKLVGVFGSAQKAGNAFADGKNVSGAMAIGAAGGKATEFVVKAAAKRFIEEQCRDLAVLSLSETAVGKAIGKASQATVKCGPTFILDITSATLIILEMSIGGFGSPVDGKDVTDQRKKLENAKTSLGSSKIEDSDWSGSAADAYRTELEALLKHVAEMVALDNHFASLVSQQAHSVKDFHDKCTIIQLSITCAFVIALAMYFAFPITGPLASMAFQTTTAVAVIATFFTYTGITAESSRHVSNTTQAEVTARYQSLAKTLELMFATHRYVAPKLGETGRSTPAPATKFLKSAGAAASPAAPAAASATLAAPAGAAASPAASGPPAEEVTQSATVVGPGVQQASQHTPPTSRGGKNTDGAAQVDQKRDPTVNDDHVGAQGAGAGADSAERAPLEAGVADSTAATGTRGRGTL